MAGDSNNVAGRWAGLNELTIPLNGKQWITPLEALEWLNNRKPLDAYLFYRWLPKDDLATRDFIIDLIRRYPEKADRGFNIDGLSVYYLDPEILKKHLEIEAEAERKEKAGEFRDEADKWHWLKTNMALYPMPKVRYGDYEKWLADGMKNLAVQDPQGNGWLRLTDKVLNNYGLTVYHDPYTNMDKIVPDIPNTVIYGDRRALVYNNRNDLENRQTVQPIEWYDDNFAGYTGEVIPMPMSGRINLSRVMDNNGILRNRSFDTNANGVADEDDLLYLDYKDIPRWGFYDNDGNPIYLRGVWANEEDFLRYGNKDAWLDAEYYQAYEPAKKKHDEIVAEEEKRNAGVGWYLKKGWDFINLPLHVSDWIGEGYDVAHPELVRPELDEEKYKSLINLGKIQEAFDYRLLIYNAQKAWDDKEWFNTFDKQALLIGGYLTTAGIEEALAPYALNAAGKALTTGGRAATNIGIKAANAAERSKPFVRTVMNRAVARPLMSKGYLLDRVGNFALNASKAFMGDMNALGDIGESLVGTAADIALFDMSMNALDKGYTWFVKDHNPISNWYNRLIGARKLYPTRFDRLNRSMWTYWEHANEALVNTVPFLRNGYAHSMAKNYLDWNWNPALRGSGLVKHFGPGLIADETFGYLKNKWESRANQPYLYHPYDNTKNPFNTQDMITWILLRDVKDLMEQDREEKEAYRQEEADITPKDRLFGTDVLPYPSNFYNRVNYSEEPEEE